MQLLSNIFNKFSNAFRKDKEVVINGKSIDAFYEKNTQQKVNEKFRELSKYSTSIKDLRTDTIFIEFSYDNYFSATVTGKTHLFENLFVVLKKYFNGHIAGSNELFTTNNKAIEEFFKNGIEYIKAASIQFSFNFSKEAALKIIKCIFDKESDSDILDYMADNINLLINMSYQSFHTYIINAYNKQLEDKHVESVTSMELPTDWVNMFFDSEVTKDVVATSPADGLILSLNKLGRVDIEYISQITGLSLKEVITSLKGSIFQNPSTWNECFYKGFETADEYLSGNVVSKYQIAKEANEKYRGYFDINVQALEKVLPIMTSSEDIYVTLGSPWVPTSYIDEFVAYILGFYSFNAFNQRYKVGKRRTIYNSDYGLWELPNDWKHIRTIANDYTFGTNHICAVKIIEHTLNSKVPTIHETVKINGKKTSILNKNETILAREKQLLLIETFNKWINNNPVYKNELKRIYNERYCSRIIRNYDGRFLTFPGMNENVSLYDYQKNAVARTLFSPNTLLAHDVGAGKTYVMIASGMEKIRLGISKKNMYVVPNNLVGQWEEIFKDLYKDAKILVVNPKNFVPSKRVDMLKEMKDGDYDAIIIAYSSFSMIPLSKRYYVEKLEKELKKVANRLKTMKTNAKNYTKKYHKLIEERDKLKQQLENIDSVIYFDDLKVTGLYVDEAHNFKNLTIETSNNNVAGVSSSGSNKCEDMLDKVRSVQKNSSGGGVVFATGTPITNSLTDIYAMQRYLQNGELTFLNLQSFDSWVGMFAEKKVSFEIDVDTNNYRMVSRYSKFHNMKELSIILSAITDFYQIDKSIDLPDVDNYFDEVIPKTKKLDDYLKQISVRADTIRNKKISRKLDNMLKVTTDGRKAALDIRLVDNTALFDTTSKVYQCAENVYNLYKKTEATKSTQLIFCDSSTPKKEFNIYDELKRILVLMGVDEEAIAFIHDATTEKEKLALFKKVKTGSIRILIGSTPKLGLGVNVQDKLVALHHLDIPWRPSDMIQREGRIIRKGNENDKVYIYRYITDGSFDAYSWQLLENKQKMIREILSGSMSKNICDELDDVILKYAEVKALALGNPLLKQRVETANEISRYGTLYKKYIENKHKLEVEQITIPNKIDSVKTNISNLEEDIKYYESNKVKHSKEERTEIRHNIFMAILDNDQSKEEAIVCNYQGFDVIVPPYSLQDNMIVYLKNKGKYLVEMGESEVGMLIRIDNFLENMSKQKEQEEITLQKLYEREAEIKDELSKQQNYTDILEELQTKLNEIDKELGVEANE